MRKSLVILVMFAALNLWGAVGFVVNSGSETLSRIDFETGVVEEVFCVLGQYPNRVGLTSEFAYIVNSGDNSIQKIDIITGDTITDIYIENSSNPYDIIIDEDHAYVTGGMINKVYKLDLETDSIESSISVGGNPAGMAILNGKLYVGNTDYGTGYSNCSVSVIDLLSFSVEATIPTEVNPQFLAAINGNIHVSCGGDWSTIFGKICIIDPASNTVTNTLDIGGVTSSLAIMPSNTVYVADGFGFSLYAYDAETFEIVYDNSNPFTPGGTMVTSNNENLFVLGGEYGQNFTVKVFDINENLLNEYTVGQYATDIKIVPEVVSVHDDQLPIHDYNLTNYPNPFNPSTTISFSSTIELTENAEISIYNLKGQKVKTFPIFPSTNSRIHQIIWNGTDENNQPVSSGIYFFNLIVNGNSVASKKCMLLK
ncbi:MAG: T9SS type A sorting domain-containing protein [Candidatus Cloacimonetes bacterium]|nr:T9SS type A sorting domain-containing protein [Candidatus Cloacimonadota bacterium]